MAELAKPTQPSPQPHDGKRIFVRMIRLLQGHRLLISIAIICQVLSLPGDLFPGLTWMYVTDFLLLNHATRSSVLLNHFFSFGGHITAKIPLLVSAVSCMLAVYLLADALDTLSTFVMTVVTQRFTRTMRNRVYHKLQEQSLAYLQRQRIGDLMSRSMGDVDELQSFFTNSVDQIFGDGLRWIGCVVLVMFLDWRVASISLAPLIIVYFLLRIFNRKVGPLYKAAREAAGGVSTRLQENLSGVIVIKIFGREKQEADRFRASTDDFYDQQIHAATARATFFPIARAVGFFSNVFMIGVGGYSILTGGSFTIGKLLAFRAYWWRLFGPINVLARLNDMFLRVIAAARRVFEVLDSPDELPDAPDAIALDRIQGHMELRDLNFAYDANHPVLHDVNLRIEPGKTVALCGPSGSGKSTILNLLLRFYDPTTGIVSLDGRSLRSIQRESLRRHFALVQQETFLFNDSILDNIRYGHPDATMQQVIAAAKAANAHGFITHLPGGYETRVGERGVRLSGGQKQRISIARAFLANPSILLLDEPTSSVEPDSETAIIAALDRLMQNRTTVLTSHRPSLINQADWVYVIEDGRVTEQGSPADLESRGGWFEKFMRSTDPAAVDLAITDESV